MMPGLGAKYAIEIETTSQPKADYLTDEYFELDLPVAPAVMVGEDILVEGTDIRFKPCNPCEVYLHATRCLSVAGLDRAQAPG